MNQEESRLMQPYRSIYEKLKNIIPDLEERIKDGATYGKSQSPGYMDLSFDYLGSDTEGSPIIALSHTFEMNGDLVPDPDIQIRIKPSEKLAEALTYQDQFAYKEVYGNYDGEPYVHLKNKKELNDFLNQWLSNLIEQGHKILLVPEREEKDFSDDEQRTENLDEVRNKKQEKGNERER